MFCFIIFLYIYSFQGYFATYLLQIELLALYGKGCFHYDDLKSSQRIFYK